MYQLTLELPNGTQDKMQVSATHYHTLTRILPLHCLLTQSATTVLHCAVPS